MSAITVVSVTYGHMPYTLPRFTYDLLTQTTQDYKSIILHDGPSSDGSREFMEDICIKHPNIQYIESEKREHYPDKNEGWGHFNRARGLDLVDTEWVWFQNCDNQITPRAIEGLNQAIYTYRDADVFWFPLVHSYFQYTVFYDRFANCHCDMAQFIVKTELAKSTGFNSRRFNADGIFIEDLKKKNPALKIWQITPVLTVHN